MMEQFLDDRIKLEKIVTKMCHNPAQLFDVENRGFLREGYYADIAVVDTNQPWTVEKNNILYKCGWSPFEGRSFRSQITHTLVNGHLAYERGTLSSQKNAMRLTFNRS